MERSRRPRRRSLQLERGIAKSFAVARDFARRCATLTDIQDLQHTFERAIERLGFHYFLCGSHVDPLNPDSAVMLLNYPAEWIKTYSELKLYCIDPVLERASKSAAPFSWDDPAFRAGLTARQRTMLEEARTFRIEHGYTIPVFSPYSRVPVYASCSVVPDGPVPPLHAMHAAQVMAYCLFDRAALLLHSEAAPLPFRLTEPQLHALERSGASAEALRLIAICVHLLRTSVPWLDTQAVRRALAELEGSGPFLGSLRRAPFKRTRASARLDASLSSMRSAVMGACPPHTPAVTAQREIERIIQSVLKLVGVDRSELFSDSRRKEVVLARAVIAWHVTERRLATLTDISKQLGRSAATLSIEIQRHRAKHPFLFRLSALGTFSSIPPTQDDGK